LVFCLFAEDVGLLPRGLFSDLLALSVKRPDAFPPQATALLTAMRDGGYFGAQLIPRFNGGLFAEVNIEPLTAAELAELHSASKLNWGERRTVHFWHPFRAIPRPSEAVAVRRALHRSAGY
jgi:hypothetical protein